MGPVGLHGSSLVPLMVIPPSVRDRKVVGSNPTSGPSCLVRGYQARRAFSGGPGGGNLST